MEEEGQLLNPGAPLSSMLDAPLSSAAVTGEQLRPRRASAPHSSGGQASSTRQTPALAQQQPWEQSGAMHGADGAGAPTASLQTAKGHNHAATLSSGGVPPAAAAAGAAPPCCTPAGGGMTGSGMTGGGSGCSEAACEAPPPLLSGKPPTFWEPLLCLPWEVWPFTLGMFIVVAGLEATGWLDSLASTLGAAARGPGLAILIMGTVSILLSNLMNNQPMTILMARVMLNPLFAAAAGGCSVTMQASSFAVVVASNVAANFTLIGALAGIMWANILQARGLRVGYVRFFALMAPLGLISAAASLAALAAVAALM